MKDILAMKANQDELLQEQDEWRERAELLLTDQRRPWRRRPFG